MQAAFAEMTNGANIAFSMLPVTLRAAARLLLEHGDDVLVRRYGPGLVDGSCAATIAITESDAGSDVGRLKTQALPQPDGTYRLHGTKIFISNGDHDLAPQIVHMVLARVPGALPGTRGISLFLVPKTVDGGRNPTRVVRLEHKMGLKGSPTCVLAFEGATGYRVGAEGRGLQQMFAMVNTMRLEVAIQGVGIAGAATARAIRHALERMQGGPPDRPPVPISEHPDVRRMLLTMRARTEAVRALTLEAALQLDRSEHAVDAESREQARGVAQWLLPICKAWSSDTGFDVANLAIQVFGGHGYVKDSGIEQYVRDVRIAGIYEGTNGIQAIDLLQRKLIGDGGVRQREWLARIRADLESGGVRPGHSTRCERGSSPPSQRWSAARRNCSCRQKAARAVSRVAQWPICGSRDSSAGAGCGCAWRPQRTRTRRCTASSAASRRSTFSTCCRSTSCLPHRHSRAPRSSQAPTPLSGRPASDAAQPHPTVVHMLRETAGRWPSREALVCGGERLSYAEYLSAVATFAHELVSLGARGERVALVLSNGVDVCIGTFAAHAAGAQVVPLNPLYTARELRIILNDAAPRVVVCDGAVAALIELACHRVRRTPRHRHRW